MSIDRTAQTDGTSAAAPRSRVHDFTDRAEIRVLAGTVGAAFVLFGLLGFVPGITTHYGELAFAGQSSAAMLFGIFRVSILLNLVYVIFGVLWLYGLVIDQSGSSNLLAVNRVDNWWHLFLCLGLIATGVVRGRHTSSRSEDMAA
jgi:hypothetical protein